MPSSNISDMVEIQFLLADYAAAIDEKDYDALDNIFLADAQLIYDVANNHRIEGPYPRIKKWIAQVLDQFRVTEHLLGLPRIRLDGDTATARTMLFNPMLLTKPSGTDHLCFFGAVYHDLLARTADGWRISRRHEIGTWDLFAPDPSDWDAPTLPS